MSSVNKALIQATQKLKKYSTSASLDAEVLLSYVLKKDKAWLLAHPEYKLNIWQNIKYKYLINKRLHHWPIAYLIGEQQFYGLKFKVNKHTLVPRPESELFIDELKNINPINQTIVDVGTGSGCLIVTAGKHLPKNNFLGIDISNKALKVAKKNTKLHCVNAKFQKSDLLNSLDISNLKFNILLANLPYLTNKQMFERSIKHEPKCALVAGKEGLNLYKQLIGQISKLTKKPSYILFEIDHSQYKKIITEIKHILPEYQISTVSDLTGKARLLKLNQL